MSPNAPRTLFQRWKLWSLPAPLVTALLAVEFCAALLVVGAIVLPPAGFGGPGAPRLAGLLVIVALLHTELGRGVERARRQTLVSDLHVNMVSVWFFAAAALLSPGWAGLCAALVQGHLWWRSVGPRVPPHRQAFTMAVFVLATVGASAVMSWLRGGLPSAFSVLVLAAGILVFFTVNSALVAGALAASPPRPGVGEVLGTASENLLEVATLCVGALVAAAMAVNPWLVVLAVPPLLVLQRAVLVRHLEQVASIDAKTGLLNSAAWHVRAERALAHRGRRLPVAALLVLDLDHFKNVNDTYGHLAGDEVLAAVAEALRVEVRDGDLVGRFGGEEFVILLAGRPDQVRADTQAAARSAAQSVADRIRRRVAALAVGIETPDGPLTIAGLSISVGAAVRPEGCSDLRALVQAADTALYAAKREGRNRVRVAPAALGPPHPPSSLTGPSSVAPVVESSVVAPSVVQSSVVAPSTPPMYSPGIPGRIPG
ncbi:MAG TPA: GGDEF domain-containing protein [Pseudonocardia sp.]